MQHPALVPIIAAWLGGIARHLRQMRIVIHKRRIPRKLRGTLQHTEHRATGMKHDLLSRGGERWRIGLEQRICVWRRRRHKQMLKSPE